jgi:hypothetical protein
LNLSCHCIELNHFTVLNVIMSLYWAHVTVLNFIMSLYWTTTCHCIELYHVTVLNFIMSLYWAHVTVLNFIMSLYWTLSCHCIELYHVTVLNFIMSLYCISNKIQHNYCHSPKSHTHTVNVLLPQFKICKQLGILDKLVFLIWMWQRFQ